MKYVLMPSWFDDLCVANVPLVGGMLVTWPIGDALHGYYMGASRVYDVVEGVGPIGQPTIPPGAVPDLRDRATFLLALDELARRTSSWPIAIGLVRGSWALAGRGRERAGSTVEDLAQALREVAR